MTTATRLTTTAITMMRRMPTPTRTATIRMRTRTKRKKGNNTEHLKDYNNATIKLIRNDKIRGQCVICHLCRNSFLSR
jgi:hypothetical protein